jgi:hypothetical protein
MASVTSQAVMLLAPKHLFRFIQRMLRSMKDQSRPASADSVIPDVPAELVDIVVDFLWRPQHSLRSQDEKAVVEAAYLRAAAHADIGGVAADVMCTGEVSHSAQQDDWTPALRALVMLGWRITTIDYLDESSSASDLLGLQDVSTSLRQAAELQHGLACRGVAYRRLLQAQRRREGPAGDC